MIRAHNMMNGELNWTALPIVLARLGVDDPEPFIDKLIVLRDFQRKESEHG